MRGSHYLQLQPGDSLLGHSARFDALFLVGRDHDGRALLGHRVHRTAVNRLVAAAPAGGYEAGLDVSTGATWSTRAVATAGSPT